MEIAGKEFDFWGHTYVMGILNVTPDSFSDGGRWDTIDLALRHAGQMIEEGAAIIDVGGESTRPGHTRISDKEELERVLPVISKLKQEFDVPVSIDTYKGIVAKEAIGAGADLVNDIWGLKFDSDMAKVIADAGVACCLMHNRGKQVYQELIPDMLADMGETLQIAKKAGISKDKVILDPGIGFGKNYGQNLSVLANLGAFHELGCPLLLGTSRKSVVGLALELPVEERLEGTLATTVLAVENKYGLVRVHDVKENVRTIQMTEAIFNR